MCKCHMKKWALINGNATITIKTLIFTSHMMGWHNIIFSDAWSEWQKNTNAKPNKCLSYKGREGRNT